MKNERCLNMGLVNNLSLSFQLTCKLTECKVLFSLSWLHQHLLKNVLQSACESYSKSGVAFGAEQTIAPILGLSFLMFLKTEMSCTQHV